MFIKLLTIITALFVGGVKAPPSIHKQRQTNTIKETTLREIKKARDYNEYSGNNSFHLLNSGVQNVGDASLRFDSVSNTFTLSGTIPNDTWAYFNLPISSINIDNTISGNFFYLKLFTYSGAFSGYRNYGLTFTGPTASKEIYHFRGLQDGFDNNIKCITDNTIKGEYNNVSIGFDGGTYDNFTFSIYMFCPYNLDKYVPYGDIYTGVQVDDYFDDYRETQNKQSYPLYGGKVTYVDNDETYILNNFNPINLNNVTYQDMYNSIDPSIETWNNTCTLTFDFNASISAGDLILYSFMFNKIQIYQSNGELFYENDYGYNVTGSFDLSSLTLNDTQKNQFINKVVLTFTSSSYRPTMQKILLRAENKINSQSYKYGYDTGLKEGEKIGYNIGVDFGDEQGYDRGYKDGRSEGEASKNYNPFTLVSSAFSSFGKLFNVEIYNGLTIGVLVCVPIIFCVVLFIIKMIKG